jgi:urease accessory protein UreF
LTSSGGLYTLPPHGDSFVTDLGGSQISTLLETLPGIANVLRSPVADALINVIRAGARLGEFAVSDAEELIKYATRRGLVAQDEGDRVLAEVQQAHRRKMDKAAEREKAGKSRSKPKAKPKPARKPAAKARRR